MNIQESGSGPQELYPNWRRESPTDAFHCWALSTCSPRICCTTASPRSSGRSCADFRVRLLRIIRGPRHRPIRPSICLCSTPPKRERRLSASMAGEGFMSMLLLASYFDLTPRELYRRELGPRSYRPCPPTTPYLYREHGRVRGGLETLSAR